MKIDTNSPIKAVMAYLSQSKEFYLSDIASAASIDRCRLLRVLEKFRNEGFLEIIDERQAKPKQGEMGPSRRDPKYRAVKAISNRKPKRPEREWKKVWRTLRHMRKATRTDLMRITGCGLGTIEHYTIMLSRHGYIKAVGRVGREKLWFLIKDVGPNPPNWNEIYNTSAGDRPCKHPGGDFKK